MELDVYFESVVTAQPILGGIESLHGYIFFKKALMGGTIGQHFPNLGIFVAQSADYIL